MFFVFQGLSHQLFEIKPPDEGESEIPGFSSRAWRTLIHEAELLLEGGDLGGAFSLPDLHAHNHVITVRGGLLADEAGLMLRSFFAKRRKKPASEPDQKT